MSVRPPAVAGQFYPDNADELLTYIRQTLSRCSTLIAHPKAIIVPHAGYIYSGLTAACAYATLDAKRVHRVLLLGPAHRMPFYGMSLPDSDAFATPLGQVTLDRQAMDELLELPDVSLNAAAHTLEHSLEVQLPFLQATLTNFTLVPVCVGSADIASVASAIDHMWGDEDTLIVISSDLSHFHTYDIAKNIDQQSIEKILAGTPDLNHEQACGATPVNGLLLAAKHHPITPHLLDYRNSGDTAGDKHRVVGYTSIAFTEAGKEIMHG
jgi:MEMO1 family protein